MKDEAVFPNPRVRTSIQRLYDCRVFSFLTLAIILAFFYVSPVLADKPDGKPRTHELVVEVRAGESIEKVNARHGTTTIKHIAGISIYLLAAKDPAEQMVELLKGDKSILSAEPNAKSKVPKAQQFSLAFDGQYAQPVATDQAQAIYKGQWAVARTRLPQAQTLATGRGSVVAILDTGVAMGYPALSGKVTGVGFDFVGDDRDPSDLPNGVDDDGDGYVDEASGHGTFISGIVSLVAPDALLMPVRVLDTEGWGTVFDLAAGVRYAVDNGAKVINVSLGMGQSSSVIEKAIDYAYARNVVLVASVGIHSPQERSGSVLYPARYSKAVAVSATDSDDLKASFSNWGKETDISAPGAGIYSTYWNGGYAWWSGTSVATAFVSGGAALVRSLHPDWIGSAVSSRLTATAFNIDSLNYPQYRGKLGAGRIDFYAALK